MSEPSPTASAPAARPAPRARWGARLVAMLLGVLVALVIAEAAFWARDDGAYPHLNCYRADDELGVALEPGCTTRVRVGGNPANDVTIDALGMRGTDPGPPGDDEILVVGDSQVFGLGVEDDETAAAVLGTLTSRTVLNGGVPTYGPLEYVAQVRRVFETRHPRTVVVIVNMANDFFEHSRPDRERHAVWDHWAVRVETMPEHVTEFPGRALLFQRSHAVLALRRWLHETDQIDAVRDVGFPSEGTLRDLVEEGTETDEAHRAADAAYREAVQAHRARLAALDTQLTEGAQHVDLELFQANPEAVTSTEAQYSTRGYDVLVAAHGHPGDIVAVDDDGESARSLLLTASLLAQAQRLRRALLMRTTRGEGHEALQDAIAAHQQTAEEMVRERARALDETPLPSVLEPRIEELLAITREHHAELVVVGLPIDVLVSDAEFAKYGAEPIDMSESRTLLRDLVASAERLGARGLDATDALRAAEPGAFLDGDLHMTARGQRALAEAIRARLDAPAPLPRPSAGLPEGRSPVPSRVELDETPEATVAGSSAANCTTHLVREWLRVSCRADARHHPTGADVVLGGHGEAMVVTTEDATTVLLPVLRGDDASVDFHWTDHSQRLSVHWPEIMSGPEAHFGDAEPAARPELHVSADDARLCACHREVIADHACALDAYGAAVGVRYGDAAYCPLTCAELDGQASPECMAQFGSSCADLLHCVRGDPEARPTCADGSAPALATGRCLVLCSDEVPCATGTCTPWQGARVCVP